MLGQQQQQEEVLSPHSPGTRGAVKVKCGEEQGDKGVCIVPGTCLDFRTLLSVPVHLQTDSASLFSFRHPNVHAAHPCTPRAPPPPIFLGHPRLVARFSLSTRRGLPLSWALRVLSSLWGEMLLLGPPWSGLSSWPCSHLPSPCGDSAGAAGGLPMGCRMHSTSGGVSQVGGARGTVTEGDVLFFLKGCPPRGPPQPCVRPCSVPGPLLKDVFCSSMLMVTRP